MLFNSLPFAVFLPLVFVIFGALESVGRKSQNFFILVVSYIFYGWWDVRFLGLLTLSAGLDYCIGLGMGATERPRFRRGLVYLSLLVNLGVLGAFKYYDFFSRSFADVLETLGMSATNSTLNIVLPVGISFYTFQTLSYTFDVYRRKIPVQKDPVAFFAFVSFFPQLVAGPIERASRLLPQFEKNRVFHVGKAKDGLRQMLWGLFKKIVVADTMAPMVDQVFSSPSTHSGSMLLMGITLFAFQIYCDFSGYTDIAIGCARLFGFELSQNFAFPFFSRNIGEFWGRWHISLSTWFRDYLFIPLGGSRCSKGRSLVNFFIVFAVIGLWHGANWTFMTWGLLQGGFYLVLLVLPGFQKYKDTVAHGKLLPSLREFTRMVVTFGAGLFALVFFRSSSMSHAYEYLTNMAGGGLTPFPIWHPVFGFALLMLLIEWLHRERQHGLDVSHLSRPVRWIGYYAITACILLFGYYDHVPYIYFQF